MNNQLKQKLAIYLTLMLSGTFVFAQNNHFKSPVLVEVQKQSSVKHMDIDYNTNGSAVMSENSASISVVMGVKIKDYTYEEDEMVLEPWMSAPTTWIKSVKKENELKSDNKQEKVQGR